MYTYSIATSFLGCETAMDDSRSLTLAGTERSFTTEPLEAFNNVEIVIAATNAAGTSRTQADPIQTLPEGMYICTSDSIIEA